MHTMSNAHRLMKLKVWSNGDELFIAESEEEARQLAKEQVYGSDALDEIVDGDGWYSLGTNDVVSIDGQQLFAYQLVCLRGVGWVGKYHELTIVRRK